MIIKKKKKGDINKKVDKRTFRIALIVALVLFLTAGGAIAYELYQVNHELASQRARLEESIADSITSYMETKYLSDIDGTTATGDINGNTLTQEELDLLMKEIMGVLDGTITEDVYNGASTLAVDQLKSRIDQAIQNALINNNIDKDTISNEIQLLVLKALENYLNEELSQILNNNNNISELSTIINQSETKIENINRSINNIQKSYEAQIKELEKHDAHLAKQIEALLKDNSMSEADYKAQIQNLMTEISKLNQDLSNANTTITNNYNNTSSQIENINNNINNNNKEVQQQLDTVNETIEKYASERIRATIGARNDGGNGNLFTITIP